MKLKMTWLTLVLVIVISAVCLCAPLIRKTVDQYLVHPKAATPLKVLKPRSSVSSTSMTFTCHEMEGYTVKAQGGRCDYEKIKIKLSKYSAASRVKFIREKVESSGREFTMPSDEELDVLDKSQDKVSAEIDSCAKKWGSSRQTSCMDKLFEKYPGLYESLVIASSLIE